MGGNDLHAEHMMPLKYCNANTTGDTCESCRSRHGTGTFVKREHNITALPLGLPDTRARTKPTDPGSLQPHDPSGQMSGGNDRMSHAP